MKSSFSSRSASPRAIRGHLELREPRDYANPPRRLVSTREMEVAR